MRAREMHPLCCLVSDCALGGGGGGGGGEGGGGDCSPTKAAVGGEEEVVAVAGVLYKWTNIGKGWRPRWFAIRGGVLAYSKIRRRVAAEPPPEAAAAAAANGVRLIGVPRGGVGDQPIGFVPLKVTRLLSHFVFVFRLFRSISSPYCLRSTKLNRSFNSIQLHAFHHLICLPVVEHQFLQPNFSCAFASANQISPTSLVRRFPRTDRNSPVQPMLHLAKPDAAWPRHEPYVRQDLRPRSLASNSSSITSTLVVVA